MGICAGYRIRSGTPRLEASIDDIGVGIIITTCCWQRCSNSVLTPLMPDSKLTEKDFFVD